MQLSHKIYLVSALLTAGLEASAGELPVPLSELQYPNIVQPTFQYKSWGYGLQDLNDAYTCRHTPAGDLMIADFENGAIKIFEATSRKFRQIHLSEANGRAFRRILPFAVHPMDDTSFLVMDRDGKRLLKFREDGSAVSQFNRNSAHIEFTLGGKIASSSKYIGVADQGANRVQIFDQKGRPIRSIGAFGADAGKFNSPESLAFDQQGRLFVLDTYNNRVQVFDQEFKFSKSWGAWGSFRGLMANPSDIFIDANNDVFITDLLNHRVQVFDVDGKFKYQFGRHPPTAHEGEGRLHYPTSVSVSTVDGSIAVCEPFESRFQQFSPNQVLQVKHVNDSAWWEKATKFHYGTKVGASSNALVVSEPDTHAILYFNLQGQQTKLVQIVGGQGSKPGEFIRPSGIAIDEKNGRLLVSDSGNRRIQEFVTAAASGNSNAARTGNTGNRFLMAANPDLKPDEQSPLKFRASYQVIASAKTSNLSTMRSRNFALADEGVRAAPRSTAPTPEPASGEVAIEPSAIHFASDGSLYVADPENNRIVALDKDFTIMKKIGGKAGSKHALNNPLDFSFSKDQRSIFVVDHYNYRIIQFKRTGEFVRQIGGPGSGQGRFVLPFGVTSGKDGYVYVTDVGAQRISKFTESGKFVSSWGRWGTGQGEFYKPKGIAQLDDLSLVVLDFGNHRAQMFDADGKFIRVFGIDNAVVSTVRP